MVISSSQYLGKLCRHGHEYNGTGQSVRWKRDSHCVECERLRKSTKEYKDKINKQRREKYKQDKETGAEVYVKKIEKQKEYNKEYINRPEVREKNNEWKRQYRRRNGAQSKEERKVKYETIKLARHLRDMKVLSVLDLVAIEQQNYDYKKESDFGLALYNRQKSKYRKAMEKGCAHSRNISRRDMKKRWQDFDNSCAYCGHKPSNPLDLQVEHVVPLSKGGPNLLSNIVPACKSCNISKHSHDMQKWFRSQPFYDKKKEMFIKELLALTPYPEQQLELLHQWQVS